MCRSGPSPSGRRDRCNDYYDDEDDDDEWESDSDDEGDGYFGGMPRSGPFAGARPAFGGSRPPGYPPNYPGSERAERCALFFVACILCVPICINALRFNTH